MKFCKFVDKIEERYSRWFLGHRRCFLGVAGIFALITWFLFDFSKDKIFESVLMGLFFCAITYFIHKLLILFSSKTIKDIRKNK